MTCVPSEQLWLCLTITSGMEDLTKVFIANMLAGSLSIFFSPGNVTLDPSACKCICYQHCTLVSHICHLYNWSPTWRCYCLLPQEYKDLFKLNTNTIVDVQACIIWFKSVAFQIFTQATIYLGKFSPAPSRWGVCLTEWIYVTSQYLFGCIFTVPWAVGHWEGECWHQASSNAVITPPSSCESCLPTVLIHVPDGKIMILLSPLLPLLGGIFKQYQLALIKYTVVLWWLTPWKCLYQMLSSYLFAMWCTLRNEILT